MAPQKITETLAKFIVDSKYQDYPEATVNYSKSLGLCFLGSVLWGSTLSPAQKPINLVRKMGGTPEVGVIGTQFKAPVMNAVLANGASDHAAELEGNIAPETVNTMTVWPVAFGVGEWLKSSGQEVLKAFIIGEEVQSRIGRVCHSGLMSRGLFTLSNFGSFGAAAAASTLMKLSVDETRVALSIAASSTSGLFRQISTMMHYLDAGLACRNGVMAALLAKDGFTADKDILDEVPGAWNSYCTAYGGNVDAGAIVDGIGKPPFRVDESGSKRYPCCDQLQRIVFGVSELVMKNNIKHEQVGSVTVDGSKALSWHLNRPQPADLEETRFSVQHAVAAALIDVNVGRNSFTDKTALDPQFVEVRGKVKLIIHPEWDSGLHAGVDIITVGMKDGTQYRTECRKFGGGRASLVSRERAMDKFREYGSAVLAKDRMDQVTDMMLRLDELPDVSQLTRFLYTTSA